MSDVMLFGVLRMPMEMAMADDLSRMQFYQRAQQAADRIAELERQIAERDAQEAKQIGREPTYAMQAAGVQAIRFDTTLLNKMWTANAIFRAMWDAAAQSAPSVSADVLLNLTLTQSELKLIFSIFRADCDNGAGENDPAFYSVCNKAKELLRSSITDAAIAAQSKEGDAA